MEKQNFKTIEINGTKFEVDLSTARKVEEFRVGDKVKVLKKESSNDYQIYPGVIIGFEWFKENPTITIAYLYTRWGDCEIKFLYYNSHSTEVEISHTDNLELLVEPADVFDTLEKQIQKKKLEIAEIEAKRDYFKKNFGVYFKEFVQEELTELI